jgi:hypothetical protein
VLVDTFVVPCPISEVGIEQCGIRTSGDHGKNSNVNKLHKLVLIMVYNLTSAQIRNTDEISELKKNRKLGKACIKQSSGGRVATARLAVENGAGPVRLLLGRLCGHRRHAQDPPGAAFGASRCPADIE